LWGHGRFPLISLQRGSKIESALARPSFTTRIRELEWDADFLNPLIVLKLLQAATDADEESENKF
jgi:hypothetical protein